MASSWVIGLVSLVVAILLVSVASAEEQVTISFAGTWTDNRRFGQNLYICTPTATTFYGVYSEYGFLIGHLENSRSVEGRWYEACIGTCCRGDFKLDLSHDGNSFTGSWTCSENPKRAFTWIETRKLDARTQTPNDYQCGALTTTAGQNLTHSWVQPNFSGEWDICQTASSSGNKYQSSYLVTYVAGASPSGYETGHFYQGGRVNQGYFDEGGSSSGTSLTLLLKSNEMLNMRWVTGGRNKTVNRDNYSDSAKHKYLVWKRDVTVEPTATECVRNQFLSTAPQTVNSANSVSVIPMLTVLLSIVIAVILF